MGLQFAKIICRLHGCFYGLREGAMAGRRVAGGERKL